MRITDNEPHANEVPTPKGPVAATPGIETTGESLIRPMKVGNHVLGLDCSSVRGFVVVGSKSLVSPGFAPDRSDREFLKPDTGRLPVTRMRRG